MTYCSPAVTRHEVTVSLHDILKQKVLFVYIKCFHSSLLHSTRLPHIYSLKETSFSPIFTSSFLLFLHPRLRFLVLYQRRLSQWGGLFRLPSSPSTSTSPRSGSGFVYHSSNHNYCLDVTLHMSSSFEPRPLYKWSDP